MLFDDFVRVSHDFWSSYFLYIGRAQQNGMTLGGQILFPTMQLATEFDGIYISELVGAARIFDGLRSKKQRGNSIYAYLDQFGADASDALFSLNASNNSFQNLCLSHDADVKALQARFPFVELYKSVLVRVNGKGSLFKFGPSFRSCYIENCALVNRMENIFRCKAILSTMIIASSVTKKELVEFYQKLVNQCDSNGCQTVRGIHSVDSERAESVLVAAGLQNLYLSPGLRETTIGDILRDHSEVLRRALKAKRIEFSPYLRWIEHDGTVKDEAIIPDFMAQREDGYFDIYDLKSAALEKHNITRGQRKRRRFIGYIEEGMAQLANYREYFTYEANAQFAANKYGITVKEPKLTLIAGNVENTVATEVVEACRRYRDLGLIDYDTLVQLFIGAAEPTIGMAAAAT